MNNLRILVNNGFTIENRRLLKNKIEQTEYKRLVSEFKHPNYLIGFRRLKPKNIKLNRDGDSVCLNINVGGKSDNLQMRDLGISLSSIVIAMRGLFGEEPKYGEINFNPSKTMETLFTEKFKPLRDRDENGYYVTTIINRFSGEPVEAYVKEATTPELKSEQSSRRITSEFWETYVKDEDNNYQKVGDISFQIDKKNRRIFSVLMSSDKGKKYYRGIGVRLHQIAIERMLQNNSDSIIISSLSEAFPFHYKCGFRVSPKDTINPDFSFKQNLEIYSTILGTSKEKLKQLLMARFLDNGYVIVDREMLEYVKKKMCIEDRGEQRFGETLMELQGDELKRWKKLIKSQPVLIGKGLK